jgi:hypothetical protein
MYEVSLADIMIHKQKGFIVGFGGYGHGRTANCATPTAKNRTSFNQYRWQNLQIGVIKVTMFASIIFSFNFNFFVPNRVSTSFSCTKRKHYQQK